MKNKYFRFYSTNIGLQVEYLGEFKNFDQACVEAAKKGGGISVVTLDELNVFAGTLDRIASAYM